MARALSFFAVAGLAAFTIVAGSEPSCHMEGGTAVATFNDTDKDCRIFLYEGCTSCAAHDDPEHNEKYVSCIAKSDGKNYNAKCFQDDSTNCHMEGGTAVATFDDTDKICRINLYEGCEGCTAHNDPEHNEKYVSCIAKSDGKLHNAKCFQEKVVATSEPSCHMEGGTAVAAFDDIDKICRINLYEGCTSCTAHDEHNEKYVSCIAKSDGKLHNAKCFQDNSTNCHMEGGTAVATFDDTDKICRINLYEGCTTCTAHDDPEHHEKYVSCIAKSDGKLHNAKCFQEKVVAAGEPSCHMEGGTAVAAFDDTDKICRINLYEGCTTCTAHNDPEHNEKYVSCIAKSDGKNYNAKCFQDDSTNCHMEGGTAVATFDDTDKICRINLYEGCEGCTAHDDPEHNEKYVSCIAKSDGKLHNAKCFQERVVHI